MLRGKIKHFFTVEPKKQEVLVRGWVRTKRDAKEHAFLEVNDGSCIKSIQIFVSKALSGQAEALEAIATGASVAVTGTLEESPGKNQTHEVHSTSIEVIGTAPSEDYPLQKKRHSYEFLRTIAHLRPRTNTFGAVFRIRNAVSYAIHRFFQERDFMYLHTPIITASDCEGAGEMFQVTTLPIDKIAAGKGGQKIDYSSDFFGKKAFLTVSGQLEGETYACALGDVYTFGPTFRAENSNTTRHLSEFWMVEPEMAFADITDDMDLAEKFIVYLVEDLLENHNDDLAFFNSWIDKGLIKRLEMVVKNKFERITYTEAVDLLMKSGKKFEFPINWGKDLQSEHEKYLTEEVFKKPIIVTDYPKTIKAFYMKQNDDGKTVRAMDVLVPGLGEIIGGSEREADYDVLKKRIIELDLEVENYDWYLDLRKYGSVPHAGFGLGLERFIQYVTGMQNIRDVIPYPRTPKNVGF